MYDLARAHVDILGRECEAIMNIWAVNQIFPPYQDDIVATGAVGVSPKIKVWSFNPEREVNKKSGHTQSDE